MADDAVLELLREMRAEQMQFQEEMDASFARILDQLDRISAQYRAGTMELRELASSSHDRRTS